MPTSHHGHEKAAPSAFASAIKERLQANGKSTGKSPFSLEIQRRLKPAALPPDASEIPLKTVEDFDVARKFMDMHTDFKTDFFRNKIENEELKLTKGGDEASGSYAVLAFYKDTNGNSYAIKFFRSKVPVEEREAEFGQIHFIRSLYARHSQEAAQDEQDTEQDTKEVITPLASTFTPNGLSKWKQILGDKYTGKIEANDVMRFKNNHPIEFSKFCALHGLVCIIYTYMEILNNNYVYKRFTWRRPDFWEDHNQSEMWTAFVVVYDRLPDEISQGIARVMTAIDDMMGGEFTTAEAVVQWYKYQLEVLLGIFGAGRPSDERYIPFLPSIVINIRNESSFLGETNEEAILQYAGNTDMRKWAADNGMADTASNVATQVAFACVLTQHILVEHGRVLFDMKAENVVEMNVSSDEQQHEPRYYVVDLASMAVFPRTETSNDRRVKQRTAQNSEIPLKTDRKKPRQNKKSQRKRANGPYKKGSGSQSCMERHNSAVDTAEFELKFSSMKVVDRSAAATFGDAKHVLAQQLVLNSHNVL